MDLLKVNNKNNFGVLRINQIMSKLLTLSKRLQLNYWHFSSFFFGIMYVGNNSHPLTKLHLKYQDKKTNFKLQTS